MGYPKQVFDSRDVSRAIEQIAAQIIKHNDGNTELALVGVQRGGVHLAARLKTALEKLQERPVAVGLLDVSMHRDDHAQHLPQNIQPTDLPFDVNGKTVVLIDDVLCSGRTVRAAMDALTDLGRPKAIQLAVLIDRGNRELPIKADFVGKEISTTLDERVDVRLRENGAEEDGVSLTHG